MKNIILFAALIFIVAGLGKGWFSNRSHTRPLLSPVELQTGNRYRVTAYCPCKLCCGKWADGYFANGEPVGGLAIATDKSIPFGTEILVPGYGQAKVKDRGGSITQNKIDVYFATHREALNWGVQYHELILLNSPK